MAVQRETEKCHKCGESYKAITRKNNPHNPFVGDNFICWDYDGHKCKVDSTEWKFEKVKCTCKCHNYPEGMIKHCMPCCKDGFI